MKHHIHLISSYQKSKTVADKTTMQTAGVLSKITRPSRQKSPKSCNKTDKLFFSILKIKTTTYLQKESCCLQGILTDNSPKIQDCKEITVRQRDTSKIQTGAQACYSHYKTSSYHRQ